MTGGEIASKMWWAAHVGAAAESADAFRSVSIPCWSDSVFPTAEGRQVGGVGRAATAVRQLQDEMCGAKARREAERRAVCKEGGRVGGRALLEEEEGGGGRMVGWCATRDSTDQRRGPFATGKWNRPREALMSVEEQPAAP